MKLLLVDDDPDIVNLIIKEFSRNADMSIDVATTGSEGILLIGKNSYDAIILDYSLPDVDGLEVLKHMGSICRSPVIVVTGKGNEEVAVDAIKLGAFDYIIKSVGYIEKLPWIVDNVITRHMLMREKAGLEEKVKTQRDYLQAIFNDMEESVVIIDREFNIIDANRSFFNESGFSKENALGNKCYVISHNRTEPCCIPENNCPAREVFEKGTASQVLHMHTDSKGNSRYVEISVSPIRCNGSVERVIEISKDITKKMILEQELINMNNELESKMAELERVHRIAIHTERLAAIGRLAAGVAHEINNPLTNASINIEIAKDKMVELVPGSGVLQKLEAVERNIDRASVIAKELLEFSRQRELKFDCFDINSIIRNILIYLRHKLHAVKVNQFMSNIPHIIGDSVKLEQVFINILNNSIEAMPKGGNIIIFTAKIDGYVEIKISDTGTGIHDAHISQVFEPFFTTKEIGSGTGLGLSICYGIIKMHNGSIDLKSEYGKGTIVTVRIPAILKNEKNTCS